MKSSVAAKPQSDLSVFSLPPPGFGSILRGDLIAALSIDLTFSVTTNRLMFQLMCFSLSLMLLGRFLVLAGGV